MKKILGLLLGLVLLTGCTSSLALLGPTSTAATGGNIGLSAVSSSIDYGAKKQTGKSAIEHAIAYADKINPERKKETCVSFIERTRSEFCTMVKKQISLTNAAVVEKKLEIVQKLPKKIKIKETSLIENIAKKSDIYNRR